MDNDPYILDSLGFPGMLASAAKRFEPDCTVEYGPYHWQRKITWEGETRIYGGAGKGGHDPIYTDKLEPLFSFDGNTFSMPKTGLNYDGKDYRMYGSVRNGKQNGTETD